MTPTGIAEAQLTRCVSEGFGVDLTDLAPVAGGADTLASMWRGSAADGRSYAVKVSHAGLSAGLHASWLLCRHGVPGVPEPVRALDCTLWMSVGAAQVSLVPWVSGRRVLDCDLTAADWKAFGTRVVQVHALGSSATGTHLPVADYRPRIAETMDEMDAGLRTPAGSRLRRCCRRPVQADGGPCRSTG